jgi:hypothetical protein
LLLVGAAGAGAWRGGLDADLAQLKAEPRAGQLLVLALLLGCGHRETVVSYTSRQAKLGRPARNLGSVLVGADSGHVRERHGRVELVAVDAPPAASLPLPVAAVLRRHGGAALAPTDLDLLMRERQGPSAGATWPQKPRSPPRSSRTGTRGQHAGGVARAGETRAPVGEPFPSTGDVASGTGTRGLAA